MAISVEEVREAAETPSMQADRYERIIDSKLRALRRPGAVIVPLHCGVSDEVKSLLTARYKLAGWRVEFFVSRGAVRGSDTRIRLTPER